MLSGRGGEGRSPWEDAERAEDEDEEEEDDEEEEEDDAEDASDEADIAGEEGFATRAGAATRLDPEVDGAGMAARGVARRESISCCREAR